MYCLSSGHYTDTWTTETAQNLDHPIWSSEDYSHVDNENGAGCLVRVRYILILIFFKWKIDVGEIVYWHITYNYVEVSHK